MATKPEQPVTPTQGAAELYDIDVLRVLFRTPLAVCRGAMEQQGWRPGKHVSKAAYSAAIHQFLSDGKAGK